MTTISGTTFDILENLSGSILSIKGSFARSTGGVDVDIVVPALAAELNLVRRALGVAVSRGCYHCAASVARARSIAADDEPEPIGPKLWGKKPGTDYWVKIADGSNTEEQVAGFKKVYAAAGWTDLQRANPFTEHGKTLKANVTEAMVERAYTAWLKDTHAEDWEVDEIKALLRTSLVAALDPSVGT